MPERGRGVPTLFLANACAYDTQICGSGFDERLAVNGLVLFCTLDYLSFSLNACMDELVILHVCRIACFQPEKADSTLRLVV